MSELELKKEKILKLVKEYVDDKANVKWNKDKDWVAYSGPTYDSEEYISAIESLLSGWLIFGKNGRDFELKFADYLGQKHGVLTNSGSSANLLMMAVAKAKNGFNLPPGSKIITPSVCFPTTLNPIIQNGFEPVFVDVDLPSVNLNLDEVENALKEDPSIRGIVFAHVLGNPPDMDRLMNLVEKYNLIFFEDACDALGGTYDGKKLGSFGSISTCSFFPAHHMTMGEGGFVGTSIGKIRKVLSSIRDWGRACYCNTAKPGKVIEGSACGNRFKNWLPGLPDVTYDHRYVFDEIGYNMKPLDLQAAMGLKQLDKLPMMDSARRRNHARLNDVFKKYERWFHLPEATEKSDPCWFAYLLTVRDGAPFTRGEIVNFLESKRIQTRSYFSGNILYHPGYQHLAEGIDLHERFPISKKVTTDSFFLGTFVGIDEEQMKHIEDSVDEFFGGRL
jgi:CDP-6-deoxy-D-xylo-4-hexulose-3-dehydrase